MVLPPREAFSAEAAGAIAIVVRRLAQATPGAVVLGAPVRRAAYGDVPFITAGKAAGRPSGARYVLGVVRAIARLRPEAVDVHQQPRLAMLLALLFPKLLVLLFLHNDPLTMRGLRRRFERRLALRRLSRVVCVSGYLKDRFMTGLGGEGAAVLHNPLTLSELPPPVSERGRTVLFVGRITTDKGPDVFIAACAAALGAMPGWSARMIGGDRFGPDSPETGYVTRMRAAAVAAGVRFEGPLGHDAVLAAMAAADIVVVPSRWAEPFGLTALEALASGAALITTGQGGLREVAGDAAVYVPAGDAEALGRALLELSAAPQRLAALREAGLERAKLFNTPVIAARLEALRAR